METTDEQTPANAPENNTTGHADTANAPAPDQNHSPATDAPHLSTPRTSTPQPTGIPVGSLSFLSNIQPDFWDW